MRLFQPFEQALHEAYRNGGTAPTGLIVCLAHVALPDFHVPDLGGGSGFEVFLYDIASHEVKLKRALWTLQKL